MKNVMLALFSVLAMAGCGDGGSSVDNVGACKAFVAKVKCGTTDISNQVNCAAYANTTCDISAYFTCLEGAYVCVNGMYDTTKLATASSCASKATCQ
jgi:hypothetical protein